MKPSDTKRMLLTVIAAIGLHLLLLTLSSALLGYVDAAGYGLLLHTLITVVLRAAQLLLPALVAYTVSGIGLRRRETPVSIVNRLPASALFAAGTGALIVLRWFVTAVAGLLTRIGVILPEYSVSYQNDSLGIAILLLTGAILPAICEELFYRRLLMQLLLPFGTTAAVIFTSLLFGIMHSYPQAMLYAALSGVVLGTCALHESGMKLCIPIHLTVNLITVLRAALPFAPGADERTVTLILTAVEIAMVIAGIAGSLQILRVYRHSRNENGKPPKA